MIRCDHKPKYAANDLIRLQYQEMLACCLLDSNECFCSEYNCQVPEMLVKIVRAKPEIHYGYPPVKIDFH